MQRLESRSRRVASDMSNQNVSVPPPPPPPPPPPRFNVEVEIIDKNMKANFEQNKAFVVWGVELEKKPVDIDGELVDLAGEEWNDWTRYKHVLKNNECFLSGCDAILEGGEGIMFLELEKLKTFMTLNVAQFHRWMLILMGDLKRRAEDGHFHPFKYKVLTTRMKNFLVVWFATSDHFRDIALPAETAMAFDDVSTNLNMVGEDDVYSEWHGRHTSVTQVVRDFWISRMTYDKVGVFNFTGMNRGSPTAFEIWGEARDCQLFEESRACQYKFFWVSNHVEIEKETIAEGCRESEQFFQNEATKLVLDGEESNWMLAFVKKVHLLDFTLWEELDVCFLVLQKGRWETSACR